MDGPRAAKALKIPLLLVFVACVLVAGSFSHLEWDTGAASHAASPTVHVALRQSRIGLVHPLLRAIFVAITFNWNVEKLVYLKLTILRLTQYQTTVDICVITNQPDRLRAVFLKWQIPATRVCEFRSDLESEQYALVWKHREIMEDALVSAARYTTFMYLEDDTDVSWEAVQSWAHDTAILEPLGFKRALVRTEFHPDDGRAALMDVWEVVNATTWPRKLNINVPKARRCHIANRHAPYWLLKEMPPACQHTDYIAMRRPYMGMYLASRSQMERFYASPYWDKETALNAEDPDDIGYGLDHWGVPERSTGMLQIVDKKPPGFWTQNVVPYDPESHRLLPVAFIEHERNAYSIRPDILDAKLPADQALSI